MFDKLYTSNWMALDRDTRNKLADVFSLSKSGITEVVNETLITDGYTNNDLAGVTVEKLSEYVNKSGTFPELWEAAIQKVTGVLIEPEPVIEDAVLTEKVEKKDVKKKKKKSE